MNALVELAWPAERLPEALAELARRAGLAPRPPESWRATPPEGIGSEDMDRWLRATAAAMGLEAEPADVAYGRLERLIGGPGPAVFQLASDDGRPLFLAIVEGDGKRARVVTPDLRERRVAAREIRAAVAAGPEAHIAARSEALLEEAGVPESRRGRAVEAMLLERLGSHRVGICWLLALPPGSAASRQLSLARIGSRVALLTIAHTAQYLLLLLAWWVVGRAYFSGQLDRGWLMAWTLVLLTLIPFRLIATWSAGVVSYTVGGLLKSRLLYGALKLEPEEVRHQGIGQLLGRVLESEAVEAMALGGGFLGLVAIIELAFSAAVLAMGAGGALAVVLLLVWLLTTGLLAWHTFKRLRHWTGARLGMTHGLVEQLVGQRTRQAQELRERWHEGEDAELERYLAVSRRLDRMEVLLLTVVPRGWLIVGIAGLAPAFVASSVSLSSLAVGLGGVLLAQRALARLALSVANLASAATAWRQVLPLYRAAARPESPGSPRFALAGRHGAASEEAPQVVEAQEVSFRYGERQEPVLAGLSLGIAPGDRVLLEGPSGGGKSTLASLLVGLRQPASGLLLLAGLDRHTLGSEGWRRRAVSAPQFHENHVLSATFAFNLLMGRRWPAPAEDLEEAETVCRDLGLGPLIDRMPAGLLQMVGETGWQLSHGERSRLFIARALLQGAELIVLDESFAALDPVSLRRALDCTLKRAPTLVVIAHP